jgi:hypothetical protein
MSSTSVEYFATIPEIQKAIDEIIRNFCTRVWYEHHAITGDAAELQSVQQIDANTYNIVVKVSIEFRPRIYKPHTVEVGTRIGHYTATVEFLYNDATKIAEPWKFASHPRMMWDDLL